MDHIPKTHLLQAARRWMFSTRKKWYGDTMRFAMNLLKAAGCDESTWLLERLQSTRGAFATKYLWIHAAMIGDDSPRANYYRGRALRLMDNIQAAVPLLLRSAEAGFAPAMVEMSNFGATDRLDSSEWIRKAADLGDPTGLFKLGPMRFNDLCIASEMGHILSYKILSENFAHQFSTTEVATFRARYVLLSRDCDYVYDHRRRQSASESFVIGRELYEYEELWGPHHKPHKFYRRCIRIYLDVTERARRAALQTTFGLRPILGRDVSRMIGRMVYGTRLTDASVWN